MRPTNQRSSSNSYGARFWQGTCWLLLACLSLAAGSRVVQASVPTPTVTIPPAGTHGFPFGTSSVDLTGFGYAEQEFFISGKAQSFVNSGTLGNDGVWNVAPAESAPYLTRILVREPVHPERFNGIVVVEWLNVSGGIDAEPDWDWQHVELLREGYAWVGVTAQFIGAAFLPVFDNARYSSILHPGDSWSYDIYSQAGMAILHGKPRPLGSLTPRIHTLLATGHSQSASRLFTYHNAIQPLARIYQGFLIHSSGSGTPVSQSSAGAGPSGANPIPAPPGVPATANIPAPPTAFIRGDLTQPVLFLNSETDVAVLGAGFSVHNQPDSDRFRMWEVAGATHADAYLLEFAGADAAKSGLPVPPFNCGDPPINVGPHTFAARTAIHELATWVRVPHLRPAIGPRFSVQIVTSPQPAAVINRDPATGNAIGGIRYPQLAVPIETLTGVRPPAAVAGNPNCILFGATDPWDGDTDAFDGKAGFDPSPTPEASLAALYPTKGNYLVRYELATLQSILQGFLLWDDRNEVIALAKAASVPAGAASNADIVPDP
jgi:hypothetical protein